MSLCGAAQRDHREAAAVWAAGRMLRSYHRQLDQAPMARAGSGSPQAGIVRDASQCGLR
jgi:hypothetical protein